MAKKSTTLEKHYRVAELVRLLANGAVTSDLVQHCAETWGIKKRQSEVYIAEAREVIVADINQDRSQVVAEMMSVCRTVIKKGMESNQLAFVLGAVNTITKLGGLEMKP